MADIDDSCTPEWLAERIDEASAAGIAAAVARLVRDGTLAEGTRLPTVRALAPLLHVGPGTVSAAWTTLKQQRFLEGGGRAGIRVASGVGGASPLRYENLVRFWDAQTLNLSRAVPDPALVPDLGPALQAALDDSHMHTYEVEPISRPLAEAAAATWPFPAEAWLASRGGYDGLYALLSTSVVAGEYVAVEEPATPRLFDILDEVRARVLPVPVDADGPRPDALRAALRHRPVAFVYEPRDSSWAGATLTTERRDELAAILEPRDVLVIENDPWGDLSEVAYRGLGAVLPHRTVMVRSYSKSHSPDLRLGVMGGASAPVERVRAYRHFGDGWTSRILQNALAWMLTDEHTRAAVAHARTVYQERRARFADLVRERGLEVRGGGHLALWVPVLAEHPAALVLASHGVATMGVGASWYGRPPAGIRIVTSLPIPDVERVADAVALAAQAR
ncbi:aminotransferase class I/II-fold pyridoxal phosphate-dependent enzyme [Georgenia alba]|uniref:Aminotransferase class I/II-fold pyridoxal phosphate-dependent enzyme n=1 Tax=Georgenia alba TaxID=2233858 RepID=A0ABW2QAP9_9MICO